MPGVKPFFIDGEVVEFLDSGRLALAKVNNGNVYHLTQYTECLDYKKLKIGTKVRLEITTQLVKVYSATIIGEDGGESNRSES